jgi:hypothetical protein
MKTVKHDALAGAATVPRNVEHWHVRDLRARWVSAQAAPWCRTAAKILLVCAAALGAATLGGAAARADSFQRVSYDPALDELVFVVRYRGTNPDHQFTLKWGPCQTRDDGSQTIAGDLLDRQSQDPARKDFKKTLHFSIAGLACRPSSATVRTAPRFLATIEIPAASSAGATSP